MDFLSWLLPKIVRSNFLKFHFLQISQNFKVMKKIPLHRFFAKCKLYNISKESMKIITLRKIHLDIMLFDRKSNWFN